jgi:SAM-dependent methyltransferase
MTEAISKLRLEATNSLIGRYLDASSDVLEIGSNDASLREYHPVCDWKTVDKYGQPDIRLDLDTEECTLPFDSESLDVVICTEVLEHFRMGSPLVSEISRVLRSTGAAIISVPNICSLSSRVRVLTGRVPTMAASGDCGPPLGGTGMLVKGRWVAGHVVDFNHERLRGYLERGNLRVTETEKIPIEMPRYLGLARKPFALPRWILPATFSDYILVAATPTIN